MKSIKSIIALSAIAITTLAACSSPASDNEQGADISAPQAKSTVVTKIPALAMQDATGKAIDLQSLKGKKVFVNLWAAWCAPCRREMPSIAALYAKADKQKTVFIMLSLDENFQSSLDFIKENNLDLPVYFSTQDLPATFNTGGIPATFIFNEAGELIKQINGSDDYDTEEYLRILES